MKNLLHNVTCHSDVSSHFNLEHMQVILQDAQQVIPPDTDYIFQSILPSEGPGHFHSVADQHFYLNG